MHKITGFMGHIIIGGRVVRFSCEQRVKPEPRIDPLGVVHKNRQLEFLQVAKSRVEIAEIVYQSKLRIMTFRNKADLARLKMMQKLFQD